MKRARQERTGTSTGQWDEMECLGIKDCPEMEKPKGECKALNYRGLSLSQKEGSKPVAKIRLRESRAWDEDAKK